jgi:hypothetical protein
MMPFDIMFFLRQQRHREMLRQAEQARLLRAVRRTPESSERLFQQALCWVECVLLSWGCALQHVGRATQAAEKGCCECL